jgi:AmmeMemoRadiSam system protein B
MVRDDSGYNKYLDETSNTICGRHPIGVLLNIINNSTLKDKLTTRLEKYAQSSQVTLKNDSSVSYASLVTY